MFNLNHSICHGNLSFQTNTTIRALLVAYLGEYRSTILHERFSLSNIVAFVASSNSGNCLYHKEDLQPHETEQMRSQQG